MPNNNHSINNQRHIPTRDATPCTQIIITPLHGILVQDMERETCMLSTLLSRRYQEAIRKWVIDNYRDKG